MSVERDLVAAIAADPDALEPRLVYGDYLESNDDPRGELIAVQAGLLAKPDDVQLRERERELTADLSARLLAGTPLPAKLVGRWHLGFVDALTLDVRTIRVLRTTHRAWFAQPAFACVREIDLESKYARSLRSIGNLGLTPTVRRLRFGVTNEIMPEPTLAAIASRLPALAALHLRCADVPELAPLRPLALRELIVDVASVTELGLTHLLSEPMRLATFGLRSAQLVVPEVYPVLATLYDGHLRDVKHFLVGGGVPVVLALETLARSKRAATVESFTGDFHRATYEEMLRAEPHRAALAHVQFKPWLGQGSYYDVEGLAACGSFLNYRLDRPAEAIPWYERALQLRPEHALARQNLAIALRKVRRLDESLVAFDLLISQSKRPTASMFNGRHYTLCELGRRAEALADLERAVSLDENFADAWNNLGVERQYIGDVDGAFAAFRRCAQLNPEHGYAVRNEADLLLELGRAGEALPIYDRLLAANPGHHPLLAMIALARLETGDAAAARAIVDARLADPAQLRDVRLYVMRALALRDLGEAWTADLDTLATTTDNPAWYAVTLFVRSLDVWRQAVPDAAITPRAIADAVLAFAQHARPANAKRLEDASLDDQMDCSELGVAAALLAHDRGLAVQRARAVATLYLEQGPHYVRKWWQLLGTVAVIAGRELDDDARALLRTVMRAVRGRHRLADVMALGN